MAETPEQARSGVECLLSTEIRGYMAKQILVDEKADIDREFYMAVTYDTVAKSPVAVFSSEGGVDVEELALGIRKRSEQDHFSFRISHIYAWFFMFRAFLVSQRYIAGRRLRFPICFHRSLSSTLFEKLLDQEQKAEIVTKVPLST
jgi:hypothetical protein